MRLELSSIRPITSTDTKVSPWNDLTGIIGSPPSKPMPVIYPEAETVLSAETIRTTLINLGAAVTKSNIALADALAKLGVPVTEANLLEGQIILARLPGVDPAAFALSKALNLPPTPAIMKALDAVIGQPGSKSRLDETTLEVLSLLPKPTEDSNQLTVSLNRLFETLGRSTENKLLDEPLARGLSGVIDGRSSLLDLAQVPNGGLTSVAADRHASFIEGQQLLNHVSLQRLDSTVPLYFAFPLSLAERRADCEVQVWSGSDQLVADALTADNDEYLRATVRVTSDRLGTVEASLVGMWSGRLICTIYAGKSSVCKLLKREAPTLAQSLSGIGWRVAPIVVIRQEHFAPLWLGGDLLDSPRSRVDQRI